MNMNKLRLWVLVMVTLGILTGCDGCDDTLGPHYTNPATITQANGLAFAGKVTIKSSDSYTDAEWNAIVANVITAFNAAYEAAPAPGKTRFRNVFGNDAGAQIVLVNNFANNWEVRDNEFKTLYLKTGSIATAGYETAVNRMNANTSEVGNATPPKDTEHTGGIV
jgi:hypothetical protein